MTQVLYGCKACLDTCRAECDNIHEVQQIYKSVKARHTDRCQEHIGHQPVSPQETCGIDVYVIKLNKHGAACCSPWLTGHKEQQRRHMAQADALASDTLRLIQYRMLGVMQMTS